MRHSSASAVLQSLIVYYIMVLLHVMMCNLGMYKQQENGMKDRL